MKVLAVSNQKGGTAKTTTTVCLAAALSERGRRVLVVDLDAQANATRWLGADTDAGDVLDVLTGEATLSDVVRSVADGIDLVPSSAYMVGAEKALAADPAPQFILKGALEKLTNGAGSAYDFCLIDCPGALGTVTVNALTAAGGVLIPVPAQTLSLEGLAQLVQTVRTVRERLNPELEIAGILACRVDGRTRLAGEVIDALEAQFPEQVLKTHIRENVRVAEAPSFKQPITSYDSGSRGAEDFRQLADEIIERTT
jgi:chromosome partitioning protein